MATDSTVVEGLREAILRGELAPNQRLVEAELCERFGASRFTVRSALRTLEAQGLVELQRNRGARIREITLEEAVEITQVRMVIEGLVAARAAELATTEDVAELEAIGQEMREAVAAGEPLRYSDLNARLHGKIRDIAGHGLAQRIIEELRGQMVRHQFQLALRPGRSAVSLAQHERVIEAVASRDPAAAEAAMRAHIASVIEALREIR
ncbi:GntR family transcriptional regulator [Phycicoccus endophyticus]|uniref:GntR family transcriptional regulator n=1 Tax=Phycicoccus endophyticus TaxID=1690220 RepID=A0A7G9R222_9MICO|nr:GntR family transcriptional regulator [Phycicoccus endophyticus]NHI19713.1 GntR family transcriptional regulator [Phycicoccus endophyticus]QNN49647.1 GntR family transcriptional regulator [Phycicoccus endophyticus]GGL33631.1 GntR family transcriptional regulator [Phycicoccus endophyticus]